MRTRLAAVGLAVGASVALGAQAQAAPPATVADLVAWARQRLTGAEDWPLVGFNATGMTLASPDGVTLRPDGLVEGDLRQEFFEPIEFDGRVMRSASARWTVDCATNRYAVMRMTLYARNDLKEQLGERTAGSPNWRPRDAMSGDAMDAMCDAVRTGERLDVPSLPPPQ